MKRYEKIVEFGKKLLDKTSLNEGLQTISEYSKDIMNAQRCSVFIYDKNANVLKTTYADKIETILIPADKGIVGKTIRAKNIQIINDPYNDPDFFIDIDAKSGFTTKSLLSAPIFNSKNEVMGVLELLNNKNGNFVDSDTPFVTFFTKFIGSFLELKMVLEENNALKKE